MNKSKEYLIKVLVNQRINRISKKYDKSVGHIDLEESPGVNHEIVKMHQQKWGVLFKRKINLKWLHWYSSFSGIKSPDFVPESIYYSMIEPILNDQEFSKSYADKNFYDMIYPDGLFPATILRNIDDSFYDNNYVLKNINDDKNLFKILHVADQLVVKPSLESGGSTDVQIFFLKERYFVNKDNEILTLKYLDTYYRNNYIIQEVICQHPFLSQFNKTSLNTIKAFTYRSSKTDRAQVLHLTLRVGAKGQYVDSPSNGGHSIGINSDGRLNNFAISKNGKKFEVINGIDLKENTLKIPFIDSVKQTAVLIAKRNIHHRLLGLDFAIDNLNNVRCIEVNILGNGINSFQLNNGTLFGEFTDEVIEFCLSHKDRLFKDYHL